MKILIIGDLHNRIDGVEDFIEKRNPALTIFLGDYFDDFGDGPIEMRKTANWLKYSLSQKNRIHLYGNHDISYVFNNEKYRAWGWSEPKQKVFDEIFAGFDIKNKLKLFHTAAIGGHKVLFTHAGWSTAKFGPFPEKDAAAQAKRAIENGHKSDPNPWLDSLVGPLWFRDTPFVGEYHQVYGHTPQPKPKVTLLNDNIFAANFDCARDYFGYITEDGLFSVNRKNGDESLLATFAQISTE